MKSLRERYEELVERLRSKGYRITNQRAAIIKMLVESQDHPSVEEIYEHIRVAFPMTSLATVYKTVNVMKDEGEILELAFGGEGNRYDAVNPHAHPHLICVRCRQIIDPQIEWFNDLPEELTQRYGYQIVNQRVDFFGICPQCQQQERAGKVVQGEALARPSQHARIKATV
jgi:Fur family peroxide stress response transcriptional regulator